MLANLIPQSLPESVPVDMNWVLWLIALVSIAVLVYGADRAVGAAVRLASALGMSKVIIGATVVSLGTTSPETFVSVTAAFTGRPGLALGNGVGSIICDTALVFGFCALIARIPKDRFILHRHGWLQMGSGLLLAGVLAVLALAAGGIEGVYIPRVVGMIFLVLLVVYLWISVRWARVHPEAVPFASIVEESPGAPPVRTRRKAVRNLVLLFLGLGMVVIGADVLVGSAAELCERYQVPQSILAVTLVAFGTSLPELVTALTAVAKGHPELLVGNVIGADILNVLFVIGASAAAAPLRVPSEFYYLHVPVMLVALALLRAYMFDRSSQFRRWQGGLLLAVFLGYYVMLVRLAPQLPVEA